MALVLVLVLVGADGGWEERRGVIYTQSSNRRLLWKGDGGYGLKFSKGLAHCALCSHLVLVILGRGTDWGGAYGVLTMQSSGNSVL